MQTKVNPEMTIAEVNTSFQQTFPFLKLKFFFRSPLADPLAPHEEADPDSVLSMYLQKSRSGEFTISGEHSTAETERKFADHYRLHVQVMRRSGSKWLITTTSDYYSLEQQNLIGQEMSGRIAPPEPTDVHEQD